MAIGDGLAILGAFIFLAYAVYSIPGLLNVVWQEQRTRRYEARSHPPCANPTGGPKK